MATIRHFYYSFLQFHNALLYWYNNLYSILDAKPPPRKQSNIFSFIFTWIVEPIKYPKPFHIDLYLDSSIFEKIINTCPNVHLHKSHYAFLWNGIDIQAWRYKIPEVYCLLISKTTLAHQLVTSIFPMLVSIPILGSVKIVVKAFALCRFVYSIELYQKSINNFFIGCKIVLLCFTEFKRNANVALNVLFSFKFCASCMF
jgi:hypothetical protein